MARLTQDHWTAIRIMWEAGVVSDRALAKKNGVTPRAIAKRRDDPNQPGGPWKRNETGGNAIIHEAAARSAVKLAKSVHPTVDGTPEKSAPEDFATAEQPKSSPKKSSPEEEKPETPKRKKRRAKKGNAAKEEVGESILSVATQEQIRSKVIEEAIGGILLAHTQHLEQRVGPLKSLFGRLYGLLEDALTAPEGHDVVGLDKRARARAALGDESLVSHLQLLVKLSESIQTQERKALGMEGLPIRGPEALGMTKVPEEVAQLAADAAAKLPAPDLSTLSTEDLQTLYDAALVLEGQKERPPIPVPPGRRVVQIEGQAEEAPLGGEGAENG
jgi:hypothetical protein